VSSCSRYLQNHAYLTREYNVHGCEIFKKIFERGLTDRMDQIEYTDIDAHYQ